MSDASTDASPRQAPRRSPRDRWRTRVTALCVTLAALLFCIAPGHKDITTSHEARVAQTARQMAVCGWPWNARPIVVPATTLTNVGGALRLLPDPSLPPLSVNPWLVPVMNGAIRLQKPPLPYWGAAALYRIAGIEWSEGLARLLPAIGGAICTLLVIDLAGILLGRRAGPVAGLVWISCYFSFDEFRKAMADPYLATLSLMAAWAWIRAASPGATRTAAWLVAAYLAFALASLAKFPVNVLHVGLLLAAYHFCLRRRLPGPWWAHLVGITGFLAICLPWPIFILTHVPNALRLWRYESVGEFGENDEKARGAWFYFVNLLQIALPWTTAMLVGIHAAARLRARRRQVALIWLALELVIFSCSNVKKNAYLLPVMPAIVLLITQGCQIVLASRRVARLRATRDWLIGLHVAAGVAFALVTTGVVFQTWSTRSTSAGIVAAVIAGAMALPVSLLPLKAARSRSAARWMVTQACIYVLLIAAMYHGGIYPLENDRSARATCEWIQNSIQEWGHDRLDAGKLAEEASVYLPLHNDGQSSAAETLALADDRKGAASPAAAFTIDTRDGSIVQVDTHTLPGHERWRLYRFTAASDWATIEINAQTRPTATAP